jgi:hypothetical protein
MTVRSTYADVCWRLLTYADVCWDSVGWRYGRRILTYADVCWRMLTYVDVYWRSVGWRCLSLRQYTSAYVSSGERMVRGVWARWAATELQQICNRSATKLQQSRNRGATELRLSVTTCPVMQASVATFVAALLQLCCSSVAAGSQRLHFYYSSL